MKHLYSIILEGNNLLKFSIFALGLLFLNTAAISQCVDGSIDFQSQVSASDVNGTAIGSVSFGFTSITDIARYQIGPGNITYITDRGIEGPTDGNLIMTFDGCIDYIRFGYALSTNIATNNVISVDFLDIDGGLIMNKTGDASLQGFSFIEADFSQMTEMAHSVSITFAPNQLTRFIIDNLEFTCSDSCTPIPTMSQWGLFILGLSLTSMAVVTIRNSVLAVS